MENLQQAYTFNFNETSDPRKATPHVAVITGLSKNQFMRQFKEFTRTREHNEINVSGEYTAQNGNIIEIQTDGTWHDVNRSLYIVNDGELKYLCAYQDSKKVEKVKEYLKDELSVSELIEII